MTSVSRTRLDPTERRAQILGQAVRLFREVPYSEVSLDQIAAETGVTRGLLHHYFGSKRNLYLEVLDHVLAIPDEVSIVPPEASGDLAEVLGLCVRSWMHMVRQAGGLWPGSPGAGIAETDIDRVVGAARDALVERMIAEVPFPSDLDVAALRTALRAFAAFASAAITEWLDGDGLSEDATHTLLSETLLSLAERVVPAMGAASSQVR